MTWCNSMPETTSHVATRHAFSRSRALRFEDSSRPSQGSLSRPLFVYQGPSFSEGQCRAVCAGAGVRPCGLWSRAGGSSRGLRFRSSLFFCCYPYSSACNRKRQTDVNREGKTVGNTDVYRRVADTLEGIKRKAYIDNKE